VSSRRRRREAARWEASTRDWARTAGCALAIDLYYDAEIGLRPYDLGLVLWPQEKTWAQIPARCSTDTPLAIRTGPPRRGEHPPQTRITNWLITNYRIAGRLYPDSLTWWEWAGIVGMKIDLSPGNEHVRIDVAQYSLPVVWSGPGVAPLAVAATYHLYGPAALIDHPGLAPLRSPFEPQPPEAVIGQHG
jgi:hypothetical protein